MNQTTAYHIDGHAFIIENFNNAKAFASFFPAIAGEWGKPMWVYYVNRGQAIACFGIKDKDGAILEFQAANKSYRQTPQQGFRTFLKVNDVFYEPFRNSLDNNHVEQRMHITSYLLQLVDTNKKLGIETTVKYCTLPNESFPALVRRMTIKNTSRTTKKIQCIDGMPVIIPYGTNNFMLKNISRLAEGWYNGVFFSKKHTVPVYKLPVEPLDRPEVIPVNAGHFYVGFYYKNNKPVLPKFVIDPDSLFGAANDYSMPTNFLTQKTKTFSINPNLTGKNKTPSAMGYMTVTLKPNETFTYHSVVGHAHRHEDIDTHVGLLLKQGYLDEKQKENEVLINSICNRVATKSSSQKFDNYCEQNFLDNMLRGGLPVTLGEGKHTKNYYVYSRIHGDMEREYNNFVILPEYFSQGNGNYRDVNQNRRSDVFINPLVGDEQIVMFTNLIQLDGFNPLKILGSQFHIKDAKLFEACFKSGDLTTIHGFIATPFSLGSFFNFLEDEKIVPLVNKQQLLNTLMRCAQRIDYAEEGECYWSDHWHYIMDLVESFCAVYPEKQDELLFNNRTYTFFDNAHVVAPRDEKYVLFEQTPHQLNAVYVNEHKRAMLAARKEHPHVVRTEYGKGSIYTTSLIVKLFLLVANKYASLDPCGVGLEMESDRPDWCDALNGLPGVFGSSSSESLALKRFLMFVDDALKSTKKSDDAVLAFPEEIADFLVELDAITQNTDDAFQFWDATHTAKEQYRAQTTMGISGVERQLSIRTLKLIAARFLERVSRGVRKERLLDKKTGVVRTNFEYVPTQYDGIEENGVPKKNRAGHTCIRVRAFEQKPLPLFLEGPVHFLRINEDRATAETLNKNIVKSTLFDKELKMLKINAPLDGVPLTIGRITIFTPGWLENESIWLHMEYKYLLELLRNNCCEAFYKLADTALVPFLNPRVYGRSIFENSSFIVSSAHPERDIHGQGFVSRLSGSTAEFISMWISMTSGLRPFTCVNNQVVLRFAPQIAGKLFTTKKENVTIYNTNGSSENVELQKDSFLFKFLGKTVVVYHNPSRKDTFGAKAARIASYILTYGTEHLIHQMPTKFNGTTRTINGDTIASQYALDVRSGKVKRIDVALV